MSSVGCYEAKTKLAEHIKRAAGGESILITKHGCAAAKLVPASGPDDSRRDRAFGTLAEIRGRSVLGMDLEDAIARGRM